MGQIKGKGWVNTNGKGWVKMKGKRLVKGKVPCKLPLKIEIGQRGTGGDVGQGARGVKPSPIRGA